MSRAWTEMEGVGPEAAAPIAVVDPQQCTLFAGDAGDVAGIPADPGPDSAPGPVVLPWFRRRRSRGALLATAALGLGLTVRPSPAHALFGIPGIPDLVIDPAAITQLVSQLSMLRSQYSTMTGHLNAFVANTRKLTGGYAFRSIGNAVATVNGLVTSGQAISYSTNNLAAQLGTTYPGYSYNAATGGAAMLNQRQRALSTVLQTLVANQTTGQQLATSLSSVQRMKAQLGGLTTAQQAAELNASVGVTQAEETTLLRQQLLASASAQQVVAAKELNDELQGAAFTEAMLVRPVVALKNNPPVRPTMDLASYAP